MGNPFSRWPQVVLRRRAGLRAMRLRLDARQGGFVLSAPPRVSLRVLEAFLSDHEDWMIRQAEAHNRVELSGFGEEILLRGQKVSVVRSGRLRGIAGLVDGQLVVPGDPSSCARRVRDFLKMEARRDILRLVTEKAENAGVTVRAVSLRDQRARWGSCTPDGRLSFSFRLVMAPPEVLDYVVAHEVAHLLHLNHGASFWQACARLASVEDIRTCRQWLRQHGPHLQAVRLSTPERN